MEIKLVNKLDATPVIFAVVKLGANICYSDTLGNCSIQYGDKQDTIFVNCLGYQNKTVTVEEINSNNTIHMDPLALEMTEIVVLPKKENTLSTPYIKKRLVYGLGSMMPYNIVQCTYVPLPDSGLQIIKVKIKMEEATLENPVRLHVYNADEKGFPGKELLDSNVIIYNRDVQDGEYTLSLTNRKMTVKSDKIFIGVEWPGLFRPDPTNHGKIGPRPQMSLGVSENRTFVKYRSAEWQPHTKGSSDKNPANMLVSIDYTGD